MQLQRPNQDLFVVYLTCMIWVKFTLIVLLALPVIAVATVLYIQLLKYVNIKNREDKAMGRK